MVGFFTAKAVHPEVDLSVYAHIARHRQEQGHDPHAYLRDVLTRLLTHPDRRIAELLPHRWQPLA